MGQFAISSRRDIDPEGLVSGVTIADADIDRITVAYAKLYFPNGVQDGEDVRPPTGQEVFDAVAKGLLDGILANVMNVERAEAAKTAQENVPPIVVDPATE